MQFIKYGRTGKEKGVHVERCALFLPFSLLKPLRSKEPLRSPGSLGFSCLVPRTHIQLISSKRARAMNTLEDWEEKGERAGGKAKPMRTCVRSANNFYWR